MATRLVKRNGAAVEQPTTHSVSVAMAVSTFFLNILYMLSKHCHYCQVFASLVSLIWNVKCFYSLTTKYVHLVVVLRVKSKKWQKCVLCDDGVPLGTYLHSVGVKAGRASSPGVIPISQISDSTTSQLLRNPGPDFIVDPVLAFIKANR